MIGLFQGRRIAAWSGDKGEHLWSILTFGLVTKLIHQELSQHLWVVFASIPKMELRLKIILKDTEG